VTGSTWCCVGMSISVSAFLSSGTCGAGVGWDGSTHGAYPPCANCQYHMVEAFRNECSFFYTEALGIAIQTYSCLPTLCQMTQPA
jgi:hypothetical protein